MAISYDRAPAARSPQTAPRGGVQKMGGASGLADVLSVILKEGIVIDAWVRVSIIGIEILTVEIRAVIASVDTYLRYAEAIGLTALAAAPRTMEPIVPTSNGSPRGLPPGGTPNYSPITGLSNSGLPGLPSMTGPSDDEILAYLEAHPDGVRLSELQAYFGSDRTALESILNRLVQQDTAVLDPQRGLYRPAHVLAPAIP